jgi:hypothetical protein
MARGEGRGGGIPGEQWVREMRPHEGRKLFDRNVLTIVWFKDSNAINFVSAYQSTSAC